MTKKKIITAFSILIVAIILACLGISFYHKQRLQTAIQAFGIHETDDIIISDYSISGLWHDQSLSLSTQKDFDLFVNENIMVPITITDESDPQQEWDPGFSFHVISFKYNNGNQTIYGSFSVKRNSETKNILLLIYG